MSEMTIQQHQKSKKEADARIKRRQVWGTILRYAILILVGIVMIYPLLWMVSATFKNNTEIWTNMGLWINEPTLDGYKAALNTSYGGDINLWKAMLNTFKIVIPKVVFTVISATITAYGFGRFKFKGRNVLYAVMMSVLFLPQVVLNIPQFIMYSKLGWVDSNVYLPIILPTLFATETYFIFMLVQFLHNVPRELEESAKIDGCNSFQTLVKIVVPMIMPAVVSCALFQFMWSSNDFMGPLLYVKTPANYPLALFVKLSMDADTGFNWNRVLATSLISIIPSLIVFFCAQDQFVEGISAGGVKG